MGKRKTRKRSSRGGEPIKVFGAYLGDETCAWYETVDSCSNGKCSAGRIKGKEKEKCGDTVNFTTKGDNISKFAPFTASASWTGSLVFKQLDEYKTRKLPIEFEGKGLINADEMDNRFVGKKNVYYIIHEVKSNSTKGPRWGLRVFRNCDVTKEGKGVTIEYPEHNDPIKATLYPDEEVMILRWGSKETPKVKYGTLLFGDPTAGGRKRRRRSTKKRRRSTKKKRRKKRKRTKKKRRRR